MSLRIFSVLFLATVIVGCSAEADSTVATKKPAQPVDVAKVVYAQYSPEYTFTTRLESPQQVDLRPRVSGVIDEVSFKEGSQVKRGDLLFKIDPRPFSAEVARLTAELNRAQAALTQAQSEAQRAKSLQGRNAMSAEQAESRMSVAQQRRAELASVQAALESALLNLQFTEVRAPINGQVSNAFITVGNTVQAGQSVLTKLVATDSLHAYFDVDERTWNDSFLQVKANSQTQATLVLSGKAQNEYHGFLDFIDNQINIESGTLRVRASFKSNDEVLRPGAFARIQLQAAASQPSILVPDRAVGTDLENRFVLVVNQDNMLEYRQVQLGRREGELRVIESGLQPNERIAVNGPARVGPGMIIAPRNVSIKTAELALADVKPSAS
ncbi:Efflux pump periplasmic linker BepF [Marinomonas gallaica]|uniref:Efflux pump periplasmic linker BepF n=1 Tax=Marinomonas gallaica TaxID=1806667 RepID=A0A1C3JNA9_9GAMM|nr:MULTISPECIES: efflux RND transporter periplasmic adaptor subunit [Marinomonas]SBT16693.1 Efflux pump periplasmic linker BepF [Marinomonas gallaica]SBT20409.1 Efflux pump periplasmic linker BepF [Marinomonas gallaica]